MNARIITGGGGPDVDGLYDGASAANTARRLDGLKSQDRETAAKQVEALFVQTLIKEMRQTLPEGGFFGKGPGSHVFQGMFEQMLAEDLARGPGMGLRGFILDSLPPEGVSPESASEVAGTSAASESTEKDQVSENATVSPEREEGSSPR